MTVNESSFFRWVIPGKIAGSSYPQFKELIRLNDENIGLIVNLTKYGVSNRVKDQINAQGIKWKRLPIPDFGVPTPELISEYLQSVCESLYLNKAVLTHCIAGCGRTGTMIGLFLTTHGYSSEEALETIHTVLGEGCPETNTQEELLIEYTKKCPNFSQCQGRV